MPQVIARYVEPLVGYLREMLRYRKYKQGTKNEIDDLLRAERAANPKRIPYYFSVAHEHPGAFMLSYIRAVNPHHEYISLSAKGFRYRKHNFENIDKLVAYFQKHFNDPLPEAPRRAVAAMVAPRSPSSYSVGSYGYSAGSRRPSESGASGFDSRNSQWGDSRAGGGGWGSSSGWGSRGNSGWDKAVVRPSGDNRGSTSNWGPEPSPRNNWDKNGGAGRSAWDNSQPGAPSQWDNVTNSEGGAAGDGWAAVPGATPTSGSGWDVVPGATPTSGSGWMPGGHAGPRGF